MYSHLKSFILTSFWIFSLKEFLLYIYGCSSSVVCRTMTTLRNAWLKNSHRVPKLKHILYLEHHQSMKASSLAPFKPRLKVSSWPIHKLLLLYCGYIYPLLNWRLIDSNPVISDSRVGSEVCFQFPLIAGSPLINFNPIIAKLKM